MTTKFKIPIIPNEVQALRPIEYCINFPPGAMGLELEPVIKSSEREIGCRVKDFYYGMDYKGIDPASLEGQVCPGDIVCTIEGRDVKSLPFQDIVSILRSLKSTARSISFKNIGASCTYNIICHYLHF